MKNKYVNYLIDENAYALIMKRFWINSKLLWLLFYDFYKQETLTDSNYLLKISDEIKKISFPNTSASSNYDNEYSKICLREEDIAKKMEKSGIKFLKLYSKYGEEFTNVTKGSEELSQDFQSLIQSYIELVKKNQ